MFTVCSKCNLRLIVTAADLRAAQGYVRCGRCHNVFNALTALSDELPDQAASADSPGKAAESADNPFEFNAQANIDDVFVDAQPDIDATGTFETIILVGEDQAPEPLSDSAPPADSAQADPVPVDRVPDDPVRADSVRADSVQTGSVPPADSALPADSVLPPSSKPAAESAPSAYPSQATPAPSAWAIATAYAGATADAGVYATADAGVYANADADATAGATADADADADADASAGAAADAGADADAGIFAAAPWPAQALPPVAGLDASHGNEADVTTGTHEAPYAGTALEAPEAAALSALDAADPSDPLHGSATHDRLQAPADAGAPEVAAVPAWTSTHVTPANPPWAAALEAVRAHGAAPADDAPVAEVPPDPLTAPPAPRPRRSAVMYAAAVVLILVLLGQVAHHYRGNLVTIGPLQQPLTALYAGLGVPLYPGWDISRYEVHQLGAVAGAQDPGDLIVRASIKNTSARAQPLPLLRVIMQDRFGNRVAARDVRPVEYLPRAPASAAMMAPDERVDAQVPFVDPGPAVVGFEIDVCLVQRIGKMVCANDPAGH